MARRTPTDAYAVLGVDPAADDSTIAEAHRTLARQHHPDVAGEAATKAMIAINAAFDLVRDPRRRAAYDLELQELDPIRAARARRRKRLRTFGRAEPPPAPRPVQATPFEPYARPVDHDGTGAAGPPPGRPSGSVLPFGRHLGWSIGEVARIDPGYLAWLEMRREGRPYLAEIDATLRRVGYREVPGTSG